MLVPEDHKQNLFRPEGPPYRRWLVMGGFVVIVAIGAYNLLRGIESGEIEPLFMPTPTPTRTASSFAQEGSAFFAAGNLDDAIQAYEDALATDPNNAQVLAELARIQTYSSSLLTPDRKRARLDTALENITLAVELAPMDSNVHAIRALVLDWYGTGAVTTREEREEYLALASEAAVRAVQLDSQNALAVAYQAEVLSDQGQWTQARQLAELAVSREPNVMDTHRVYAAVLEATGFYSQAIEEYQAAAEINPNLTFLYISIGQNYRQLTLYDEALDYFDRAADINEVLGIQDPLPYIAIAKTYSRQGEFFIAARNAQRALEFDPTNPDIYGQLGIIFFRSRNYEGSIPVLRCAVEGCSAAENDEQGVEVTGMALNDATVVYYYTYGSVLAALNQCDEAVPILEEVRENYSGDAVVLGIVQESLFICEGFTSTQ